MEAVVGVTVGRQTSRLFRPGGRQERHNRISKSEMLDQKYKKYDQYPKFGRNSSNEKENQ